MSVCVQLLTLAQAGTGQNLADLSTALTNLNANSGYNDWLRFRGYLSSIDTLAISTLTNAIAPAINLFAAELSVIANTLATIGASLVGSGDSLGLLIASLLAEMGAYTTLVAAGPGLAATRSSVVGTPLTFLRSSAFLDLPYARRNVQSALDGSTQRALDQAAAALELMVTQNVTAAPVSPDTTGPPFADRDVRFAPDAHLSDQQFHTELDAFLQGRFSEYDYSDPAFQTAFTAFVGEGAIIAASLLFTGDVVTVTSASIGTTAAVITLGIAVELFAASLASIDLQVEAYVRGMESDLPDNIQAVAKIVERYSDLRDAVAGNSTGLATAVMSPLGQAAAPGVISQSMVSTLLSKKAAGALASVQQAQALLGKFMSGGGVQSVQAVVSR
ncbi:MAG: hypothetical protein WDW36_000115 [Sanguina aurantia]